MMRIFHDDVISEIKVTKWLRVQDYNKAYYPVRIEYSLGNVICQTIIKCPTEHRQDWVYRKLNKRRCIRVINSERFKHIEL